MRSSNQITVTEQKKIIQVKEWYLATNSSSMSKPANFNGWSLGTMPSLDADHKYLWNCSETVYSLGSSDISTPRIVYKYATNGESALTVYIDSSNGNIFRAGNITTILTCYVFYGTQDVTDYVTQFNWIKKNSDGTIDEDWNRDMSGNTITLTDQDVYSRASFYCEVEIDTSSL